MTTTPEAGNVPEDVLQAAREACAKVWERRLGGGVIPRECRAGGLDGSADMETAVAAILAERERHQWFPIDQADRSIATVQAFPDVSITIRNSNPVWVRDDDGRTYEAVWTEGVNASYWWDLEGESPVDPVEFMPHPLDPRFHAPKGGAA